MSRNIVQAEFFHVGGKNVRSLEHLFAEIGERVVDGLELALNGERPSSGIKTVVRFYDDGTITRYVKQYARLEQIGKKLSHAALSRSWPLKSIADKLYRLLLGIQIKKKDRAASLAATALAQAIKHKGQIGIEKWDHSFRPVKPAEVHELIEKVVRATSAWIFVFDPNDLLADSNKAVAHLM